MNTISLTGSFIEERFVSWKHFIPFPRGYVFWTSDDENKQSIFLRLKNPDTNFVENSEYILCDVGNFFSDSEYSKEVLKVFKKRQKTIPIELRMREASLLSKENLRILFQRHNGFLHSMNNDTITTESIMFLSCCYGWDENAELPEELRLLRENCGLSYEKILYYVSKEVFSQTASFDLEYGAYWKKNVLGPFCVFNKNGYWHVGCRKNREVIMRNFLNKMDAQLHTESLYSFYTSYYRNDCLKNCIALLDYILLDDMELERGVLANITDYSFVNNID